MVDAASLTSYDALMWHRALLAAVGVSLWMANVWLLIWGAHNRSWRLVLLAGVGGSLCLAVIIALKGGA